MSLFDLQDVCTVIGSLATLDLPMVVDLIGILELKGLYCTLTMTDWFMQELSVIPRGSWGDAARRFTMIRWHAAAHRVHVAPYDVHPSRGYHAGERMLCAHVSAGVARLSRTPRRALRVLD
ncbi:hypothetical protein F511_43726 [Dorcoceras hygrometricum]|uniref:Uncharacterized protein n=1 Tax=Dorcoceras hygrometricum TaxID=472368 RepID=A0A2Z7ANG7_9LAMI|nr:hypothetical protein F511_43726 [Dorcoceras hygrometricum]